MTDDCPISFETRVPLLLSPKFVAGEWFANIPAVDIVLEFDKAMNTGMTPANGSWAVEIDSLSRAVGAQSWDDSTHLRVETVSGGQPSVSVTIELLVDDPDLRDLDGTIANAFGPETIPAG